MQLPLEQFDVAHFNAMLPWMGISGCSFARLSHANANESYSADGDSAALQGHCELDGTPWHRPHVAQHR